MNVIAERDEQSLVRRQRTTIQQTNQPSQRTFRRRAASDQHKAFGLIQHGHDFCVHWEYCIAEETGSQGGIQGWLCYGTSSMRITH